MEKSQIDLVVKLARALAVVYSGSMEKQYSVVWWRVCAVVFVAAVLAWLARWDVRGDDPRGVVRLDRWTGSVELLRFDGGYFDPVWCSVRKYVPEPADAVKDAKAEPAAAGVEEWDALRIYDPRKD